MDLLAPLLLTCSLVSDTQLVSTLAKVTSEQQTYHVRYQGDRLGQRYTSKDQAKSALRRNHEEAYVGLLGIPRSITKEGRYSLDQLLDPCRNIALGTDYLKTFLEDCETSKESNPRGCAVKLYAQWTGQSPERFARQVGISGIYSKSPIDQTFSQHSSPFKIFSDPKVIDVPKSPSIPQPKLPTPPTPPSFQKSK